MNRLSILLLLCLLAVGTANAARVEPSDDAFSSGASSFLQDVSDDESSLTIFQQAAQITSQTDPVPPTLWIVGLGLCLVYVGYKMKNKAE